MIHIKLRPLIISLLIGSAVAVAFYFIDKGVAAYHSVGELGEGFGDILLTAKWLIIAGIIVKGILLSLKK